jgi:hypothetical protein
MIKLIGTFLMAVFIVCMPLLSTVRNNHSAKTDGISGKEETAASFTGRRTPIGGGISIFIIVGLVAGSRRIISMRRSMDEMT